MRVRWRFVLPFSYTRVHVVNSSCRYLKTRIMVIDKPSEMRLRGFVPKCFFLNLILFMVMVDMINRKFLFTYFFLVHYYNFQEEFLW